MNIVDDPRPIYASPMDAGTYSLLGLDRHAPQAVNNHGRYGGLASADGQFDIDYNPCAEAFPDEQVASGIVTSLKGWNESVKYPETISHHGKLVIMIGRININPMYQVLLNKISRSALENERPCAFIRPRLL